MRARAPLLATPFVRPPAPNRRPPVPSPAVQRARTSRRLHGRGTDPQAAIFAAACDARWAGKGREGKGAFHGGGVPHYLCLSYDPSGLTALVLRGRQRLPRLAPSSAPLVARPLAGDPDLHGRRRWRASGPLTPPARPPASQPTLAPHDRYPREAAGTLTLPALLEARWQGHHTHPVDALRSLRR